MTEILISLQEAIEAIESVPEGNWKPSRYVKELEKLDPVQHERKKGKWFLTDHMYACNQCHSVFNETSPFCPNCGSDMQGSEQE